MIEKSYLIINSYEEWKKGKKIVNENILDLCDDNKDIYISQSGLALVNGYKSSTYISGRLDSGDEKCTWHRLIMNADIPENTWVKVQLLITDDDIKEALNLPNIWLDVSNNQKDVIIPDRKGKYLWIKIVLGRRDINTESPVVRSIRATFPRETYLQYLPAIYQEDQISKDFLERYLSIYETLLTNMEEEIDDIPRILDPICTPNEYLAWLSTWVGAVRDDNWPEDRWREFLGRAAELYKHRGTRFGLSEIIKIFSGRYPIIVEPNLTKCGSDPIVFRKLFGCRDSFCVLLPPHEEKEKSDMRTIRRIIEREKPAHTRGGLVELQWMIRLDWHTYLGLNTILAPPEPIKGIGELIVPFNTYLYNETLNSV